MRVLTLASAVLAAASLASADPRTANIYVQPVDSSSAPVPLAEVTYDISTPEASASVTSYDAPSLPGSISLIRIGVYDTKAKQWTSSTSVASVENLGKGYAPHFTLSVDATKVDGEADVLGASLRGVRIDAGQTRDFGPQAKVLLSSRGKQPELNKPIVLSPEGKNVEKEEKTFLQKFVAFRIPSFLPSRLTTTMRTLYADFAPKILVDDRHRDDAGPWRWGRWQIELGNGSNMRLRRHGILLSRSYRTKVTRYIMRHQISRELTAHFYSPW